MQHHERTKAELIADLEASRRRVAELEARVAEHAAIETALRESESRFRTLVDTIPHGIQECDTAGRITFTSRAHCRMNGYADGELAGMSIWDLLDSEAGRVELQRYLKHLVDKQPPPTPYAVTNRRKDGSAYDVQVEWDYRRDADGTLVGFIAVITDVTDRNRSAEALRTIRDQLEQRVIDRTRELAKANAELTREIGERQRAEAALRDSEEKLRSVLESSHDCILVWDRNHDYLYANQAALDHVGVTRDHVVGKNIRDGLGHVPEFMKLWVDQVFASGKSLRVEDAGPVGERVVYSESVLSPIRNDRGEVFAVGVVYRDVTERKTAEEALQASEERFRRAFEEGPLGTLITDAEGRILQANRAIHQMLGYAEGELTGRSVDALTAPEDIHKNREIRKLLGEHTLPNISVEKRYLRKHGGTIWGRLTAALLPVAEGEPVQVLGMVEDITERMAAQTAVEEEQRHLRRLLEMHEHNRQLVAYEIHDGFVQSLVGAQMLLDLPREQLQPEAVDRHAKATGLLNQAIEEARQLISGQRPLILDERGLLAAIEHLVCEQQTADGPEIEYEEDVSFEHLVAPLETVVFRVVQEGLTNALRHSQSPRVSLRVTQSDHRLCVKIQDWGVGFDPEQITPRSYGLEGIRERARLFHGSADIQTRLGQGTTMIVEFPIVEPPPDDE